MFIITEDNKCVIYNIDGSNKVIANVSVMNNWKLPLKIVNEIPQDLKVVLDYSSWLWHKRFGHLSFNGLHLLYDKNMVNWLQMMEHKY